MDADAPSRGDLTPGARRTRTWRRRMKECKRVVKVEVGPHVADALVAAGLLRDGDASQRALEQAVQRTLEAWARDPRS